MKNFLLSLISILTTAMLINYFVDPASRWHKKTSYFKVISHWQSDNILALPPNFDDRAFKADEIKYLTNPDLLVLGSSRAMLISQSMFVKNLRIFNAAVTNSTVEDYIAFWELLKEECTISSIV
jgi:hypothetical protein